MTDTAAIGTCIFCFRPPEQSPDRNTSDWIQGPSGDYFHEFCVRRAAADKAMRPSQGLLIRTKNGFFLLSEMIYAEELDYGKGKTETQVRFKNGWTMFTYEKADSLWEKITEGRW